MMKRQGISLVEVIIAIGLVSLLFGGIYASYVSIVDVVTNSGIRTEAAAIAANQIELIRNLPYEQVGTLSGIPSGILPQTQTVTSTSGNTFIVSTYVRNIDDPFDGVIGGTPNDTAPNDYKLVELSVRCINCSRSVPLVMTTTVAPKSLESASSDGSLFITVLDANGQPVPTATVQIVNASVTPSINLIDTTNASGVLQLIGTPTSSQRYAITVSKAGYSSEKTYVPGDPLNPVPTSEYTHASVAAQTVSSKTFLIDRLSSVTFRSLNATCQAVPNQTFALAGQKTIGTNVLKFATSSTTDASGLKNFSLEWDTYNATATSASYDLLGTMPLRPFAVNPSTTLDFSFIFTPSSGNSLLVTVRESSTSALIPSSTVILTKSGFSETKQTARSVLMQTDWSGGDYDTHNGEVDVTGVPGSLRLNDLGGSYSTTTTGWLVSSALDIGSTTGQFYTVNWLPASSSQQAGADIRFQLASNNDNTTWNFVGPDNTPSTYYTTAGQTIDISHLNHRYLKYKVFLSTTNELSTPVLDSVWFDFYGVCVPPSQVLFQGLATGSYTVTVSAPGYTTNSSSVAVAGGDQEIIIDL